MSNIAYRLRTYLASDSGASAVEYAVIAAVITVAFVTIVAQFSPQLNGVFVYVGQQMTSAAASAN